MQVGAFEIINKKKHNFPLVVGMSTGSTACVATVAIKCMSLSVDERAQKAIHFE